MASFRLFDLNPAQHQAVVTTEGPLLILAGAGTGKTRVITARVAYLLSQGVDPMSVLAVTFTNKAATEMRERLAAMVDPAQAKKVTMSTFHALCVRILRQGIDRLGYKNNFSIYDESDQSGLIKKIITRTAARDEKLDPNLAKNLISKAKNNGWSAPEDEKTLIGAVFARYQQELKTLNAVDFDDLLLLTVKLLNEHADVREHWQQRFRFVMVDEFQDTNRLQLEMISRLVQRADGSRSNICVVGDDDQSIYGWRGAEVSNILEFERHFPEPTVVKLEQNYRSTNSILGVANSLIRNNPRRRPKNLWSEHETGAKARIIALKDDREEADFVVGEIEKVSALEGQPWENMAVLYRMNAQSRLLEQGLRAKKIPYRLVGGKSFFDRREIKDVLAYMTCLENSDDDVSLLRIINTPARGISAGTVERALELSIQLKMSLFQALEAPDFTSTLSARAAGNVSGFVQLIRDAEGKIHAPLANQSEVFSAVLEEIGYFDDLRRSCKTPDESENRERNVRDMLGDFVRFEGKSSEGLRGFLDEVSLDQNREEEEKEDHKKAVTLITLHAAKGLEFPHVFLLGLEEGLLPHERSRVEGTVDEERRLLYVGITRARRTLTMTWCKSRLKFGSPMHCRPSTFIKELAPEHVELVDYQVLMNTPVSEESVKSRFAALKEALGR